MVLDRSNYLEGIVFAIITMVCIAVMVTTGRALKSVHYSVVQLNYAFWGVILSIVLIFFNNAASEYDHRLFVYERTSTYAILLIMGLANTLGMFGLTYTS